MNSVVGDTFILRFENISTATAGRKIAVLRQQLLDDCPGVQADIRKDDKTSQDFGATHVLVLGAPAVVVLAKGIEKFLSRDREGELVIERDGRLIFRGNSGDAALIAKAIGEKTTK